MSSSTVRRRVRGAALGAALLAVILSLNLLAYSALTSAFPGLRIFPPRHPAAPRQLVAPAAPKVLPAALTVTPADRALRAVTALPASVLLGGGWSASTTTSTLYGSPFSHGCGYDLAKSTAPTVVRGRSAHKSSGGVAVQLWAFGAGQATPARQHLRNDLGSCDGRDGVNPAVSTTTVQGPSSAAAAAGLLATDAAGRQGTVWLVWQRGDVLASVGYTTLDGPQVGAARRVAAQVDTQLVKALGGICADLDPAADDAKRSPYVKDYQAYSRDVVVTAPAVDEAAQPKMPKQPKVDLPRSRAHPELAPPYPAAVSSYRDADGDGFAESPPPISTAYRGAAPVFRDPDAFVEPKGLVTEDPQQPDRPSKPDATTTISVAVADPTGPGCGWSFTGQPAPDFDLAELEKSKDDAVQKVISRQTEDAARYRTESLAWAQKYQVWAEKQVSYDAWREFVDARAQARADSAAAQQAYDSAVRTYQQQLTPPPQPDPEPEPEPDPEPTEQSTATPSPVEPLPSSMPTSSASSTPKASQ